MGFPHSITDVHRPGSQPTCRTPSSPWAALNQTRSASTNATVAIGVLSSRAAMAAIRSKASSGGLSRMS